MSSHEDVSAVSPAEALPEPAANAMHEPQGNVAHLTLPPTLTSRYASALIGEFQALRGQSIAVDASSVQQVGSLCLQVLISARNTWKADGQAFRVTAASDEMTRRWSLFGMPPGMTVEYGG